MNVIDSKFNVPDYVSCADPDKLNISGDGAVVVEGMRIDNPAAAWISKSEILKNANEVSHHAKSKVDEACRLFGITDDSFVPKEASSGDVELSDGEFSVVFNVVDSETLNKAASELLERRDMLPYLFARDCAQELRKIAISKSLSFTDDKQIAMRKLAGAYHVDQDKVRELVSHTADIAESVGMSKYANELTRIKDIVKDGCPDTLVPLVIEAVDQVNKAMPLNKRASSNIVRPENIVYITNRELLQKNADDMHHIGDYVYVSASKLSGGNLKKIVKWASDSGYNIPADSSAESVSDVIRNMPGLLRKEFVDLFA